MRKTNLTNIIDLQADNEIYEGQSVERYVEQAEVSKQPIEGGAPEIFTPRKDGVKPEYNIRTDRFEIAQKAMEKVSASYKAKRADWIKSQEPIDSASKDKNIDSASNDKSIDSAEPAA